MRPILLVLLLGSFAAHAFPTKPVRFVVPFPGGFSDVLARQLGARMGEALGQPAFMDAYIGRGPENRVR